MLTPVIEGTSTKFTIALQIVGALIILGGAFYMAIH